MLQRLSVIDWPKRSSRNTRNAELTRRLQTWFCSSTWSWTGFQNPVRNQWKQLQMRKRVESALLQRLSRQAAAAEACLGLETASEWQMPCWFLLLKNHTQSVKPLQTVQLIINLCFADLPNKDSDSCPWAHQTLGLLPWPLRTFHLAHHVRLSYSIRCCWSRQSGSGHCHTF